MTVPNNGFQGSESILKTASGGFHDAAAQTRLTMTNLETFLDSATKTYQGTQAQAFRALHLALQDEQEIVRQSLDFLEGGAADGSLTLGTTNQNIADDQMNLLKQTGSGGGAIFSGLTTTT
jgi:hypothetical protein